jgi:hypothetical protein
MKRGAPRVREAVWNVFHVHDHSGLCLVYSREHLVQQNTLFEMTLSCSHN